jgi:hypothetical protein
VFSPFESVRPLTPHSTVSIAVSRRGPGSDRLLSPQVAGRTGSRHAALNGRPTTVHRLFSNASGEYFGFLSPPAQVEFSADG